MNEDKKYLTEQIITYMGNKRKLLKYIANEIELIMKELNLEKCVICDLFSGSGVVARMLKQYSTKLIANDLEKYSYIINDCYLTNYDEFDEETYNKLLEGIKSKPLVEGVISKNYAPSDDNNIMDGERVFYTHKNAMLIDTYRNTIEELPNEYRKFFLAPLLCEASIHVNTNGNFKGFFKSKKTNIGKFGGDGENALDRIMGDIELHMPIFSSHKCDVELYNEDANELVKKLNNIDIAYIDPPYNEHPYASNYFMLNTIANNELGEELSQICGIPKKWNKSMYNKMRRAYKAFEELISNIDTKYAIISYNNEGIIPIDELKEMLSRYGVLKTVEIDYYTYKGCKNRKERNNDVTEYLFVLDKRDKM